MKLFEACAQHLKPLEFFGRYDHTVAVDPAVLKWFLDKASPNFDCKLVPDILHAKVIWWVDAGAYIGSANLSDRAWISNIEAGKVEKFGEWLLRQRSREGRTVLELLNYVVWGNGSVSARLWNAIRSDDWAIPHIGLSSLGEIVGWARPDEFPPRNMRTSKGLRALGYNVRIGV